MHPSAERRRSGLRGLALLLFALTGAMLAACGGSVQVTPDDGQAPILIRGRVVDALDVAVPTRAVQISILDHANAKVGEPVPVISQGQYNVALDGTFEARLAVTPEIDAFAARTDHVVSFDIVAIGSDGNVVAVFVFSRGIAQGTWGGDVPYLTLRSEGASEIDEHPAQP